MGHMIEDRHLRPVVEDALRAGGIERRRDAVRGQAPGPAAIAVETEDGALRAPLLVGADGRGGRTAERAGIVRTVKRLRTDRARRDAADRAGPSRQPRIRCSCPPALSRLLPMTGGRVSIVWTEAETEAARVAALPDEAFLAHLRPLVGGPLRRGRARGRAPRLSPDPRARRALRRRAYGAGGRFGAWRASHRRTGAQRRHEGRGRARGGARRRRPARGGRRRRGRAGRVSAMATVRRRRPSRPRPTRSTGCSPTTIRSCAGFVASASGRRPDCPASGAPSSARRRA